MNPLKSEKFLLWFTISFTIIVIYLVGDIVAACIAGAIITMIAFAVYMACNQLSPAENKWIVNGSIICLVPFAMIGAVVAGQWIPWLAPEKTDSVLDAKIAKAQMARATAAEKESQREAQEAQKKLASTLTNVAQNVVDINDKIDDFKENIDKRFERIDKRMDKIERAQSEDRKLLNGLIAPKPPEEPKVIVPSLSPQAKIPPTVSEDPPLEWKPVSPKDKKLPKAKEIQPAEPQPKIEHWALVAKCNCGKLHPVNGFWNFPDGTRIPDYTPCTDKFGRPCAPESYEQVIQK